MGNYYNGYSWQQREAILQEHKRLEKRGDLEPLSYYKAGRPCDICADPQRNGWHSEDYSRPFLFKPPATFAVCAVCHLRLHKRFAAPSEWHIFLIHIRNGGYGREFTSLYGKKQRDVWAQQLAAGELPTLPAIRPRILSGTEWWQHLTLNPESLTAAWARPRPWRPRPSVEAYRAAINNLPITAKETAMLVFHANCPLRATTMRQLASQAFSSDNPSVANAQYGTLAHRLCEHLSWEPDRRTDGSPIWMSVLAEGWKPKDREFEWVMVPSLAEIYKKQCA